MINKAFDIIRKKKVERLGEGLYNVVGVHGTYSVGRTIDGIVTCNCPGFAKKRKCSHSLAVILLNDPDIFRKIQKNIWRTSKL